MITHWLNPLQKDQIKLLQSGSNGFYHQISIFGENSSLSSGEVAIIGIQNEQAFRIRKQLFTMAAIDHLPKIWDLGNVRSGRIDFLTPLFRELIENGVIPVVIGAEQSIIHMLELAMKTLKNSSIAIISNRKNGVNTSSSLSPGKSNLIWLGLQRHIEDPSNRKQEIHSYPKEFSLSEILNNVNEVEPVIRDAQGFVFNLDSMNSSSLPSKLTPSEAGFDIFSASQMMRYAGMNEDLKAIGLYGYICEIDQNPKSAHTVATLLWYFFEGLKNQPGDNKGNSHQHRVYTVHLQSHDLSIKFLKSLISERWWIVMSDGTIVSCSKSDYDAACRNELTQRVMSCIK